eukprot:54018-Hanusia_phi.AAC.1
MAAEACRRRGSDRATEDHPESRVPRRRSGRLPVVAGTRAWPPRLHADTLRLLSGPLFFIRKSGAGHSGTTGEEWTVADRQGLSGMA